MQNGTFECQARAINGDWEDSQLQQKAIFFEEMFFFCAVRIARTSESRFSGNDIIRTKAASARTCLVSRRNVANKILRRVEGHPNTQKRNKQQSTQLDARGKSF